MVNNNYLDLLFILIFCSSFLNCNTCFIVWTKVKLIFADLVIEILHIYNNKISI